MANKEEALTKVPDRNVRYHLIYSYEGIQLAVPLLEICL